MQKQVSAKKKINVQVEKKRETVEEIQTMTSGILIDKKTLKQKRKAQ